MVIIGQHQLTSHSVLCWLHDGVERHPTLSRMLFWRSSDCLAIQNLHCRDIDACAMISSIKGVIVLTQPSIRHVDIEPLESTSPDPKIHELWREWSLLLMASLACQSLRWHHNAPCRRQVSRELCQRSSLLQYRSGPTLALRFYDNSWTWSSPCCLIWCRSISADIRRNVRVRLLTRHACRFER